MGLGDQLLATGMARGAAARGKRIAFGDGQRIIWDHHSEQIFAGNPNIAVPGQERSSGLHWIPFYRGNRIYNRHDTINDRWVWDYNFKAAPGEIFFTPDEIEFGKRFGSGFVVIEPNVPSFKSVAVNKQWPVQRFEHVAARLLSEGHDVVQFANGGYELARARKIKTPSFRHALAVLAHAKLYVGPEGGLHHGAAAVAVPAVILFGGFIPPQVTGYDTHTNLTGGATACGSMHACPHCKAALDAISVDQVIAACQRYLLRDTEGSSERISAQG